MVLDTASESHKLERASGGPRQQMVAETERKRPGMARNGPSVVGRLTVPLRRFLGHHIFSSLTRRILFLNLAALGVLVLGILYLNQFRDGLIEAAALFLRGEVVTAGATEPLLVAA